MACSAQKFSQKSQTNKLSSKHKLSGQRTGPKGKEDSAMALTRKLLKGMGLTDEQVDTIIEAHTDTVDGLKADLNKYKGDAEKLPDVQKELDDLKAKGDDGWKDKHDKVKKDFDDYKAEITNKETRAAKEKAVRAYLGSKNIEGANLNLAMRSCSGEIDAVELDGDKIKDTKAFDDLVKGDFSGLVTSTTVQGARTSTPPANTGVVGTGKTRAEIEAIKDGVARRAEMAKNLHLFPEIASRISK